MKWNRDYKKWKNNYIKKKMKTNDSENIENQKITEYLKLLEEFNKQNKNVKEMK